MCSSITAPPCLFLAGRALSTVGSFVTEDRAAWFLGTRGEDWLAGRYQLRYIGGCFRKGDKWSIMFRTKVNGRAPTLFYVVTRVDGVGQVTLLGGCSCCDDS